MTEDGTRLPAAAVAEEELQRRACRQQKRHRPLKISRKKKVFLKKHKRVINVVNVSLDFYVKAIMIKIL